MKIIDKAKGFYEDHKDGIDHAAKTAGFIVGVCIAAKLGYKFGETIMAAKWVGNISGHMSENPGLLLTEYATKIGIIK